jgi:hypothetical protein
MSRARSASASGRRLTEEEITQSEAAALQSILALNLKVFNPITGLIEPFEPETEIVTAFASRFRTLNKARTAAAKEEAREGIKGVLEKLAAKIMKSNLAAVKKHLEGRKLFARNDSNLQAIYNMTNAGNSTGIAALIAELTAKKGNIKKTVTAAASAKRAAKASARAEAASADVLALRAAGFDFNNAYKLTAAGKEMMAGLSSGAGADNTALARAYFTRSLKTRREELAAAASSNIVIKPNALEAATAALTDVRKGKKVEPQNAERYARLVTLAAAHPELAKAIKPEHYYEVFREAFKTRRATKGNNGKKSAAAAVAENEFAEALAAAAGASGMGAGAGAGMGARAAGRGRSTTRRASRSPPTSAAAASMAAALEGVLNE